MSGSERREREKEEGGRGEIALILNFYSTDRCLRAAPICIDTFNSSIDTGHYTFNVTSGQCERFPSGCTSLPIFSNLMECQSNCNPGSK